MSKLHPITPTGTGEPKADVIFVHGLGGGPFTTWQHDRKKQEDSWPYWLAAKLPEVTVHVLDYEASSSNWLGRAMPLTDRAKNVLDLLAANSVGRVPIVFVCHSLGGLVVKKLLQEAIGKREADWAPIAKQTKVVVFLATPHLGSDVAVWARRLGPLLRSSPAIKGLVAHAPDLTDLYEWYQANARPLGIRTISYYESYETNYLMLLPWIRRLPFVGRLPTTVQIVAKGDANPGIEGATPRTLDADHITICKPESKDDALCRRVVDLVREVNGETSILVEARATAPKGPTHLPADLPDFQGRQEQIERLKAILIGGGPAAVTAIGGMGGVGKSALALHVAHQLADAAPDGRIFVDLGGTSPQPLSSLAAMITVIQALRPEAQTPTDPSLAQRLYRSCLDGKRVLLLFDSAANSAQVAPIVEWRAPTTLVIVTARQHITAPGLKNNRLDVMDPGEAHDLLRVTLSKRSATDEELDALSERCGRLPLALRVAGTFLALNRDWSVADYIEALADQRQRLAWLRIKDDARLDVHAVLGLSARKLAEDTRELFERWQMLAVFPASFDRTAAAAVWDEGEDSEARNALSELLRRSMLIYDEADDRYRLHDLMRDVARLPLKGEDQATVEQRLEEAAARHAKHYYTVLARAQDLYLKGGESVVACLVLYDLEQRNIAVGQAWAVERIEISDDAARLSVLYADAGVPVLSLRLAKRAWLGWLEAQLKACRKLGLREGEPSTLGNLGHVYRSLGEVQRAIEHYGQSLAIAREIGDRQGEGGALGSLGIAYDTLGEARRAIEHHEQYLAIAREIGDRRGEGIALGNLGVAHHSLGEPRVAIEHHEQHLAIAREIGDPRGEAAALGNLGLAYWGLGELQRAIEHHEQQLVIAREIGDRGCEGNALSNSALAFDQLGERAEAIRRMEEALAIFEEIEDPNSKRARARLAWWRGEDGG